MPDPAPSGGGELMPVEFKCPACGEPLTVAWQEREREEDPRRGLPAEVLAAMPPEGVSAAELDAARSPRGAWTAATLAGWGVPWPRRPAAGAMS